MTKRKPIQIAAFSRGGPEPTLIVLCEDGTIWECRKGGLLFPGWTAKQIELPPLEAATAPEEATS